MLPGGTHASRYTCRAVEGGPALPKWDPPVLQPVGALVLLSLGGTHRAGPRAVTPGPVVPRGAAVPWLCSHLSPRETPCPSRSHGATMVAVALAESGVGGQQRCSDQGWQLHVCVPQAGDTVLGAQSAPPACSTSLGDKSQQGWGHGVSLGTVLSPPTPRWGCPRRRS